ncbi:hypothetical protein UlMin_000670 [Ulmus minor]
MGGGMETNKNKFIEDWSSARENLEHNFRWSRRNLALVGLFGIALPIFAYKGIVREFVILFSLISVSESTYLIFLKGNIFICWFLVFMDRSLLQKIWGFSKFCYWVFRFTSMIFVYNWLCLLGISVASNHIP